MAPGISESKEIENETAPFLERLLFRNRLLILVLFILTTVFLGYQASSLRMEASFEKMIPTYHSYIANYLKHKNDLKGLGNVLWISVENTKGDIFDSEYLDTLRRITETVFYIPGVARSDLKSLWTPNVRWTRVTEEGFEGGAVIPQTYDGSQESLDQLRINVLNSGYVGRLVANNFRSSMVIAPLSDKNYKTGEPLDYYALSRQLEKEVRDTFQSDEIKIHIVGFAKVVGDLIAGAVQVGIFFGITVLMTMGLLYWYTRCWRCTLMPLACALVAVIWQSGMLYTLGFGLDPYSMLVPFLVFAIGVSHGVQMINANKHWSMLGKDKYNAARFSFRILYIPALCALITDGIGFAVLYVIRIGVLQDMAVGAAIRFPVLIICMLVALPILMSYVGVSESSIKRLRAEEENNKYPVWERISRIGTFRWATTVVVVVAVAAAFGFYYRRNLQIGDLDPGAPELRPDSRYNMDNAFAVENYTTTSDVFVVMVETPPQQNSQYDTLVAIDRLQWQLRQQEGVQSSESLCDEIKLLSAAFNEGYMKWCGIPKSQLALNNMAMQARQSEKGELVANRDGTLSSIFVYLDDHKAATLTSVVDTVGSFAAANDTNERKFQMAAGLAGIEAATNIEIEKAQTKMLILVYGVVTFLVLLTFRSLRATLCIMIPLGLTSLLCEVLMPLLGIGVKVATLPVISVGVGIGVDYGVYIYSRLMSFTNQGMPLVEAYFNTLKTTGKAVAFTGITLAAGVCTWSFSPIKFQADMGILLSFMFLWNMIGAICLLPALAFWLLPRQRRTNWRGKKY
jgi:uncharacterized protein